MTDSLLHYDEFFFSVLHIGYKTNRVIVGSVFLASVFSFLHLHLSQCFCCAGCNPRFGKEQGNIVIYHAHICCPNPSSLMGTFKKATYLKTPWGYSGVGNILTKRN